MSAQEHIFYLLRRIPRNDDWKVFLKRVMDKNATMTASPNEIVTKLVKMEAATKRENGLAPEALHFAKEGGTGGDHGGKAGEGSRTPQRDERDNEEENDRRENDLWKCLHRQRQGHLTENHMSKKRSHPTKSADAQAKASTEALATSTLTTSIENYWVVAR
jgi:hypothetical protein